MFSRWGTQYPPIGCIRQLDNPACEKRFAVFDSNAVLFATQREELELNYRQLITFFGGRNGVTTLADALGITKQSVYAWETSGISKERRKEIEGLTDGAIKASELPPAKFKPKKKSPFELLQARKQREAADERTGTA